MINAVFALRAYRARNDDVALNSTSWTYAQDTAWTQDRDTPYRLRVQISETAGGVSNNVDWTMQYSVNGGTWTELGSKIVLSPNFADLEVIDPAQLGGTGTFLGGVGQETSPSTYRVSHVGNDYAEIEYNLLLDNTLSNGDVVTFRALANGATTTSVVTPTLTVSVVVNNDRTGTGAVTSAASTVAGTGTRTIPERTGTGAVTSAAVTVAGTGTYVPAPIAGDGAVTSSASTIAGTGTYAEPNNDRAGDAAVTSSAATVSASGTRTIPERLATGAISASSITVTATGIFIDNSRVGTGAVEAGASTVAGTGTFGYTTVDLYAQVFAQDGTTPLTNEILVSDYAGLTTGYQDFELPFTIQGTPTKSDWDSARLKLSWAYQDAGGDVRTVRVTSVELAGTYEVSDIVAIDGAGAITTGASSVVGTGAYEAPQVYLHLIGNGTLGLGASKLHYFKQGSWHPYV